MKVCLNPFASKRRYLEIRGLFWLILLLLLAACERQQPDVSEIRVVPTPTLEQTAPTQPTPPPTPTPRALPTPEPTSQSTAIIQPTVTPTPMPWRALSSMLVPRSEMPALALDGRIYVSGGFGNGFNQADGQVLEAYDIAVDSWIRLAEIPFSVNHHGMAKYDGLLYLFPDQKKPVLRYDPALDIWTELSPMPENRWAGTAVTLNDFIYYVGGAGGSLALLKYDPLNDSWTSLADLNQPREHSQAVVLNGEIYALGGRWNTGLNQVEIYNPEADSWRRGPPMKQRRSGFGAAVWNNKIIAAGGELLSPLNIMESIEIFDLDTNQWQLSAIPLPMPLHGFPLVAHDQRLYIIGGSGLAGDVSNRGILYRFEKENLAFEDE